ncbi:uncharacterized protein C8Q71DRAFT_754278 [Rhodofomes roseus]|uniref:Uncharacterized protein n=1 Tax=Rhodofomes roseus TaxID=34475 RepID=A0ABQ8KIX3_9APHY|nr:uncharacterized protein C8Q71DRAFT_754278 [Rhodofomes roseus]KAH9837747.1 hypothetical protein C8Q71DRAFT_754278 [Rhodofomes roseus]
MGSSDCTRRLPQIAIPDTYRLQNTGHDTSHRAYASGSCQRLLRSSCSPPTSSSPPAPFPLAAFPLPAHAAAMPSAPVHGTSFCHASPSSGDLATRCVAWHIHLPPACQSRLRLQSVCPDASHRRRVSLAPGPPLPHPHALCVRTPGLPRAMRVSATSQILAPARTAARHHPTRALADVSGCSRPSGFRFGQKLSCRPPPRPVSCGGATLQESVSVAGAVVRVTPMTCRTSSRLLTAPSSSQDPSMGCLRGAAAIGPHALRSLLLAALGH